MNRKTSKTSLTRKMKSNTHNKSKRKSTNSASSKKNNILTKNRHCKRSSKAGRKSFYYEYQIKSRLTWEYADVFCNIESWDASLKGDEDKGKALKAELQHTSEDSAAEIAANELSNEDINFDQQNRDTFRIDDKPISTEMSATTNRTVIEGSTSPLYRSSGDVRQNVSAENSPTTTDVRSTGCSNVFNTRTSGETNTSSNVISDDTITTGASSEGIHRHAQSRKRTFKCPNCPKDFFYASALKTHQRTHSGERPYKCTKCPKMFKGSSELTKHQRTHSGEKPYKCTECPMTFSQSCHLTSHQRTHSGEKPYKCTECPKMFKDSSNLATHQRMHSGEKPYKCTECPKVFKGSGELTSHRRTHSGEKPHKCTECPKMFSWRWNLRTHQRIHSGEKPYKCTECPKMFSQNSYLAKHQRTHSGEKPFGGNSS